MIVLDASAALRAVAGIDIDAVRPLGRAGEWVAPDLFLPEVQNAVLKYRRAGTLTADQAGDMVRATTALIDGFFSTRHLSDSAWKLASELDHSPYDCLYLALALELNTYVLTADGRLSRKLEHTKYAVNCVRLNDPLSERREG